MFPRKTLVFRFLCFRGTGGGGPRRTGNRPVVCVCVCVCGAVINDIVSYVPNVTVIFAVWESLFLKRYRYLTFGKML